MCGCHPGTEDNGWHEYVCQSCRESYMVEWRRIVNIDTSALIERIKEKNHES